MTEAEVSVFLPILFQRWVMVSFLFNIIYRVDGCEIGSSRFAQVQMLQLEALFLISVKSSIGQRFILWTPLKKSRSGDDYTLCLNGTVCCTV